MVSYDERVSRYYFSPSGSSLLSFLFLLIFLSGWSAIVLGHPIGDLKTPQCFIVSPSGKYYFIASANGDPGKRDNNGFITKLGADGELIDLHFIHGGTRGTHLHSPNGMAIVGKTLYVADLDTVRGFDINTGQSTVTLSFSQFHVTELTDLIADGRGQLFVLDTEGNAIYQIDTPQDHIVTLYLHHEDLASPRGLAVHPRTGRLVVVSLDEGTVLEIDQDLAIHEIISNSYFSGRFRNLSGVDFDQYGNMYLSDLTAGKIWRVQPNQKMRVIAEFLISPSSVRVDRTKHMILVPYLYAQGAEMNGLEQPANAKGRGKKKQRTLSDYGLGMMGGDTRKQ